MTQAQMQQLHSFHQLESCVNNIEHILITQFVFKLLHFKCNAGSRFLFPLIQNIL